jgi:hypothetical protein
MSTREIAQEIANNPKIASGVSAATTGAGLWVEWIPDDIGKIATLVGIILSCVLIYTHIRRGRIEYEKTQLEISILREKEAERIDKALQRRAAGKPTRREDDVV